jgi:thymidylate kinase
VLLDRYPIPNVTVRGRALDGPRIRDTLDASHGLIADLAAREERLYRELPRPDHLIVLRVSPAVAQARRPEHAADDLAARAEAISALDAGDLPLTVIDADRPLDEVLATVRATIWRLL